MVKEKVKCQAWVGFAPQFDSSAIWAQSRAEGSHRDSMSCQLSLNWLCFYCSQLPAEIFIFIRSLPTSRYGFYYENCVGERAGGWHRIIGSILDNCSANVLLCLLVNCFYAVGRCVRRLFSFNRVKKVTLHNSWVGNIYSYI